MSAAAAAVLGNTMQMNGAAHTPQRAPVDTGGDSRSTNSYMADIACGPRNGSRIVHLYWCVTCKVKRDRDQ